MGCGVSSGSQISPISADLPYDFKNGSQRLNCSNSNSAKSTRSGHLPRSVLASAGRFHLGSLFLCRFYGNNATTLANGIVQRKQCSSTAVQTDNDIGFKCQQSQTDSLILSDQELEAMMEELEKELKDNPEDSRQGNSNDEEIEDEIEMAQKSWKGIIKAHKEELETTKRFANIAIQATTPKATSATQTKFGSIDHQYVPNPHALFATAPINFLEQNQLLTMTLSENLLKVIEQPSALTTFLTSFDEDEEDAAGTPMLEGDPGKIVDSIQKTLANYDSESRKQSTEIESKPRDDSPQEVHPNAISEESPTSDSAAGGEEMVKVNAFKKPSMLDARKKLKDAQKRLKLLKQQKFNGTLELILGDIRNKKNIDDLLPVPPVAKRDVSLQTERDILTDEAPHFAARPPLCHKNEMIPSVLMFRDIDRKMQEASKLASVAEICQFVCKVAKNDLFKIRALFIWVTSNIKFSSQPNQSNLVSAQILSQREGVSKDYCQLFVDLCRGVGIRAKIIEGFVRGYDFRPGHHFSPELDGISSWNAVFVLSSWRFIDLALASGFTDAVGEFHQSLNEYYFLTDPNVMIWTHFPYSQLESDYDRWQLLDKPLSIEQFNEAPKVTGDFFEYNLSVRSKMVKSPLQFRITTEIKIGSHETMRYKFKFYKADEVENSSLNHYVFCQLKEDRLVGSFMISPPIEGRFLLKIFAKPEREMHGSQQDIFANLNPVISLLLECTKARKYIEPLPISELPWGPTQKFFDFKLKLINQKGPTIVTWGGRRRLVMEANETMLLTYSLFDAESMEMDARSIISRDDVGLKTTFTINPPRVGTFKLMLFGMPKPKQKGKWRLPLLATFMVDCKLIKPPQHDEDMLIQPIQPTAPSEDGKNDKNKSGKK